LIFYKIFDTLNNTVFGYDKTRDENNTSNWYLYDLCGPSFFAFITSLKIECL